MRTEYQNYQNRKSGNALQYGMYKCNIELLQRDSQKSYLPLLPLVKKIAAILLLTYYSLGTTFLPMGNFSYINQLPEMYAQCQDEDPDMNIPDFIFEHFLNLEDIISAFEQNTGSEENERPHQPYTQAQHPTQIIVTMTKVFLWESKENLIPIDTKSFYPLQNDAEIPSAYLSEIFHPPSFS